MEFFLQHFPDLQHQIVTIMMTMINTIPATDPPTIFETETSDVSNVSTLIVVVEGGAVAGIHLEIGLKS